VFFFPNGDIFFFDLDGKKRIGIGSDKMTTFLLPQDPKWERRERRMLEINS